MTHGSDWRHSDRMHGPPPNSAAHNPSRQSIAGRWVIPVEGSPIEHGIIEIENGRIVALHQNPTKDAVSFDDAVIIPGLINAHTHLEFISLEQPLAADSFAAWIRAVVAHRRTRSISNAAAAKIGLRDSAASGTVTVGEIATKGWSGELFADTDLRAVIFRELLALHPDRIPGQLSIASEHLEPAQESGESGPVFGLSPHAPYSVHPELFREVCGLAAARSAPIAFHLAETREELQLLDSSTGPLVDLFREMGFWIDGQIEAGTRPLDYLQEMARAPQGIVIHGNYLSDSEIEFLAEHSNLTVVYCPRTHHFFRHAPHPWLKLHERGVRVALGTDSRASNPDLSLWNEIVFLHERFPDVAPALLLQMATRNGAGGLGIAEETGSIVPGKAADLTVIQPAHRDDRDAFAGLLSSGSRVVAAMRGGKWIQSARLRR
ncbi:MAG: hypothetical protein DWQ29_11205 [Planctomycetota bacterium]|nr:MAG: hypothetical protein DWQ29_11205 [Planctomycetota bacterium]